MNLSISSAHALRVRGAKGFIDEVDESRRVVDRVMALLRGVAGVTVRTFHDNVSTTQSGNLTAIRNWHRQRANDRHISIHFNAFKTTDAARGTEVLHRNHPTLAATVSRAMADAGRFINRGAKHRTN